jgi:hypothetical protein
MVRCPDGHESASDDYCSVCGMRIVGAPTGASAAASGGASAGAYAPSPGAGPGVGGVASAAGAGNACPVCFAPKSGSFCEACGYNFSTGQPAGDPSSIASAPISSVAPSAPVAPSVGGPPPSGPPLGPPGGQSPAQASTVTLTGPLAPSTGQSAAPASGSQPAWTAVVAADRGYYETVEAASGPDGSGISFPGYCPERRFQLTGSEMRIGRRSPSRGLNPEIDLTGPPTDPGISRLHAVLIATSAGWAVLDPGSANGTQVNGTDIPSGEQIPLHDGDRISLGAWTTITVHGG